MLAIVKAVNFALAICHPFVLCHLELGPRVVGVRRQDLWLGAEICHEILEAHGRPDAVSPDVRRQSARRVLCSLKCGGCRRPHAPNHTISWLFARPPVLGADRPHHKD
jgi:hypothetical protein